MGEIINDSSNEESSRSIEEYHRLLDEHRMAIVQSLDLDRHFVLTYLRSRNILDEEDCQLVQNSGTTRQQKNSKFLDILSTRGEQAMSAFVEALEYELPALFESFTGQKASTPHRDSLRTKDDLWSEFDKEYLCKELSKLSELYSTSTYMYEKKEKEKQLLEKRLLEVTSELNSSLKSQEELRFELSINGDVNGAADSNYDQKTVNDLMSHCQALVQENADKSNIIIALQARLLAVNEDRDGVNRHVEELQMKNKNLMQQVKDLTFQYDFQRTRSIRLQEKYDRSSTELNRSSELNRQLHMNKFNLTKVTEEKEELASKLEEYRNVVTALNAKLCLLKEQKEVESEKRSEISEEYIKIRQQAKIFEMERDQKKGSLDLYKDKVLRLEETVSSCREQIAFLTNELENTARERGKAIAEREEVIMYNNELLKSRDEAVRSQMAITKKLEERYNKMTSKLDAANKELKDVMLEKLSSSSIESRAKCEIFEAELDNAKKTLRKSSIHKKNSLSVPTIERNEDLAVTSSTTASLTEDPSVQNTAITVQQDTRRQEQASSLDSKQQQQIADKSDVSRTTSVLDQAKAVLDGKSNTLDFSLNNRQLSWVYDSLKGNTSSFQAILNNPFVFPQFDTQEDQSGDDERCSGLNGASATSPGAEKRRIGSNRMSNIKTKRSFSNTTLETVKSIIPIPLSPTPNRRKSLTPAAGVDGQ